MRIFFIGLLFLLINVQSNAGSGTAILICKSESGRTTFTAHLQDIVGLLEGAEFTIDESTIKFKQSDNVFTIFDPKNGVLTLYLIGKSDPQKQTFLKFFAIPLTFKIIKNESTHQVYEFKAKIQGTEPRKGKGINSPEIELSCRLEYQI